MSAGRKKPLLRMEKIKVGGVGKKRVVEGWRGGGIEEEEGS
jgi:hypothetical protein